MELMGAGMVDSFSTGPVHFSLELTMRALRLVALLLAIAAVASTTACTNPTGPAPAQDDVASSKI